MFESTPPLLAEIDHVAIRDETVSTDAGIEPLAPCNPSNPDQPAPFGFITENLYISPVLYVSKDRKRAKRMVCECQFDPEMDDPEEACGENCLNRVLMIECGSRCPCGEYCTNKRFQRANYANVKVFKTENKGWGLRACKDIRPGEFVMEYCGEVCTLTDFEARKVEYVRDKRRHYYFMSLRTDEILDATSKGNYSRYINHSCDPNCETQKWTVGGRLRIGFFSIKRVRENEELTFDYKFKRFGNQAQKCYCGSASCRGYIGQSKQNSTTSLKVLSSAQGPTSPRSPRERRRGRIRLLSDADNAFEKEVYSIVGSSWRLRGSVQVLSLSRIMLQAETTSQRGMLLQVLLATKDTGCLKKFLSLQGLRLLWSWMIDSGDSDTDDIINFRIQMLQVLDHLPLTTRNQLEENKLLPVVRKWRERPPTKTRQEHCPKENEPVQPTVPTSTTSDDHFDRIIVTEADSAQSEGICSEGATLPLSMPEGDPVGNTEKMDDSCEAEARYLTSDHSQDSDSGEPNHMYVGDHTPPYQSPRSSQEESTPRELSPGGLDTLQEPEDECCLSPVTITEVQEPEELERRVEQDEQHSPTHSQGRYVQEQSAVQVHSPDDGQVLSQVQDESRDLTPSPDDKQSAAPTETTFDSVDELSDNDGVGGPPKFNSELLSTQEKSIQSSEECINEQVVSQTDQFKDLFSENNLLQVHSRGQTKELECEDEHPVVCGSRDKLVSMAEQLVEKWEGLKEVFRIPKRAQKSKTASTEESSNEGGTTDGDGWDDLPQPPRKRSRRPSPERTWSRKLKSSPFQSRHSTHPRPHNTSGGSHYTPSTPPQPHTLPMYSTGFTAGGPVQNTVIVQHPGQGVYVQQHVFKDSCHTTVLPAQQYLHAPPPTSQFVQVHHQAPGTIISQQGLPPTQQSVLIGLTQQSLLPQSVQGASLPHNTQVVLGPPGGAQQVVPSMQQGVSTYTLPQSSSLVGSVQQASYLGYQAPRVILPQSGTTTQPLLQATGLGNQHLQYNSQVYMPTQSGPTLFSQSVSSNLPPTSTVSLMEPALSLAPLPPPPPNEGGVGLPLNWKTAHDQTGKAYYYHVITRKTQWERPTDKDAEGTIIMDLGTPEPDSDKEQDEVDFKRGPRTPIDSRRPHTPDETPPLSPTGPRTPSSPTPHSSISTTTTSANPEPNSPTTHPSEYIKASMETSFISEDEPTGTLESDSKTTDCMSSSVNEENSPTYSEQYSMTPSPMARSSSPHDHSTSKKRSSCKKRRSKEHVLKESFRHKVSKLVTQCLDQHRKPDCKYGRITCVEDFKHLARKLSHGLTEKEISRKGGLDKVALTDSVRTKAKEYIRHYMKKFGAVYVRNRSP